MNIQPLDNESFEYLLPTPQEMQSQIPLTPEHQKFICEARGQIEKILNGTDPRLLLIVGPCSIHDLEAAREYSYRLSVLAREVADRFFIVMRTYFEKSRSILGWKGFLYDPDLNGTHHLEKGIRLTRKFLAELTSLGIPTGAELLDILSAPYYSDFLTWGCIGARTCTSPTHRQLASSVSFPVGFKNSTDGNINNALHGIYSASKPHTFIGSSQCGQIARVHGEGNPLCHLVLRGGEKRSNYDPQSVALAVSKCRRLGVSDKIIIDCSHDNCKKNHALQIPSFQSAIDQIVTGNRNIVGVMLESNLFEGSQPVSANLRYGVSITDPCLNWETTELLIKEAYLHLSHSLIEMISVHK